MGVNIVNHPNHRSGGAWNTRPPQRICGGHHHTPGEGLGAPALPERRLAAPPL